MKRSGIVAVTSAGLAVTAAACGSAGVSTTPARAPATSAPPATSATPASPASPASPSTSTPASPPTSTATSTPAAHKAAVGDTIDLSDSASGKHIAVTVVKVIDPDAVSNGFETPPGGDRFESIQFRIVNVGSGAFQDDPLIEITAKDAAGQNMQQHTVTSTAAGAQMPSSVNLSPGDTALGFVTFDVPAGDKIAQTQYTLDLGLGTTGEWQIGNGQSLPPSSPPSSTRAAPTPTPTPTSSSAASPQDVVEQYFAAITAHNYALAWALGGKNVENGSYDKFVQGFSTTSADDVTIVSTSGDTVTIQLDATQTDGTHKFFAGTYTVKNGVIVSAEIHRTGG